MRWSLRNRFRNGSNGLFRWRVKKVIWDDEIHRNLYVDFIIRIKFECLNGRNEDWFEKNYYDWSRNKWNGIIYIRYLFSLFFFFQISRKTNKFRWRRGGITVFEFDEFYFNANLNLNLKFKLWKSEFKMNL